jgi:hypothetical protein
VSVPERERRASRPLRLAFVHAFTPAAMRRTNYVWAVTREEMLDDAEVDALIKRSSKYVFSQGVEGLQAMEAICARDGRAHVQEKSVKADMPGVLMRRIIGQQAGQ